MKQEPTNIIKVVEHKYGLHLCEKTEFVKQMLKRLTKYEKKLMKIENYEKMHSEGKNLSKEVFELIKKKQSFIEYLSSLKDVVDIYVKTSSQYTQSVIDAIKDTIKAEVEEKAKQFKEEELKKLSDFFVVAEMLKEKDHISPTPLVKVPKNKEECIMNNYTKLTNLTLNKETTMKEETKKVNELLCDLLKDEEMNGYIESMMRNEEVADMEFKISEGPEYEFVMLQPADRLEMSEQVKVDANTQIPKPSFPLVKSKVCAASIPEVKGEEVQVLETLEKPAVYGNESEARSLVSANQESEFEIAISRSTRRKLRREMEMKEESKDQVEEYDRKYLNQCEESEDE
jgi:hypothetical protein